jgi:hypothetical protein
MKRLLSMVLLLSAVQAQAYKITENYVIFEKGDDNIVGQYKAYLRQNGIYLQELPRNNNTKEQYARLDDAKKRLHDTYLDYFKVTKEDYPMPYVIYETGQFSANFSAPTANGFKPSNFISLSVNHISNDDGMWTIMAHEMAHYYHRHASAQTKFVKASHSEDRELTQENGYGMDIDNEPALASKLDTILLAGRRYEGNRATVSNLSKIRIGPSDPMIRIIAQEYKNIFVSVEMACSAITANLNEIIAKGDLTTFNPSDLNKLAKSCTISKNAKLIDLLKYMYNPTAAALLLSSSEQLEMNKLNASTRTIIESHKLGDHPIVTALKLVVSYRTELKNLVDSINWETLQFYTHEDEADITAFKILNELGIAHYQLTMLEFVFNKNKCVDSITNAEIEIEYFGATELDTHHSSCWRVYRTLQMLKDHNKMISNVN